MKRFLDKNALYVYWLRAPMLGNKIVYAGAAHDPEARRRHAQKRYNMVMTLHVSKAYVNHAEAKTRETAEIAKHWLTVFNLSTKSCVPKDYAATISKMKVAAKARGVSPQATEAAARVNRGRQFSKAHRKAISLSLKGVPHLTMRGVKFTTEHCERIGDGNKRRVWTEASREKQRLNIKDKPLMTLWNIWESLNSVAKKAEKLALQSGKKGDLRKAAVARSAADKVNAQRTELKRSKGHEEKVLLQSGYGHPWRIKDLDKATQEMIA